MKKAFTMIELVFVIAVIGILSAVAIPKLAPIVGSAHTVKGKATLSSVRGAIATEKQKLLLQGIFGGITKLRNGSTGVFTKFVYKKNDGTSTTGSNVLEYDVQSCTGRSGCWHTDDGITYDFYKTASKKCTFKLVNNRFKDETTGGCTDLTQ